MLEMTAPYDYYSHMKPMNEKIPNPKELEKEISDFLSKKFGNSVKIVSPVVMPQESMLEKIDPPGPKERKINFDLKPEDLVSYLDQFIIKQDRAKAILSTKICTHFNRIKRAESFPESMDGMVGSIKNNVLMIGPTGVGKTYIIKLIAKKIGVPFVKGDATKFSETGYVGGDVEDLVRDLVREADGDIELAQYGIIYIDEIDKIASARNMIGADVSRTGVQRALLKPMEETEVDMKVSHDPISMLQEIERFRKTGKRDKTTVNTQNILFIMSGAFSGLTEIIQKRMHAQEIGFGAKLSKLQDSNGILKYVKSEDLIEYGFESEFVGRLPVRAMFERLTAGDLYEILKNPNNPIVLGKKLDFDAYGIQLKFEDAALRDLADQAFEENTGARGLVSAVERALLPFEKKLPSTDRQQLAATLSVIKDPERELEKLLSLPEPESQPAFERLREEEKEHVEKYVAENRKHLAGKFGLSLTGSRIETIASLYGRQVTDIGNAIKKIKGYYDEIKKIELYFFKNHDINLVLQEDAVDYIIEQLAEDTVTLDTFYQRLSHDFEYGLKLILERTGKNRFFISRKALMDPDEYLSALIKNELSKPPVTS
jgi:endopeptidase Clp ATP-binding regulatory subunit ClpX